jgi:hypothetical protein
MIRNMSIEIRVIRRKMAYSFVYDKSINLPISTTGWKAQSVQTIDYGKFC